MAFNSSPEVAVARDAAKKLQANRVVIVYTTEDGKLGMASYGADKRLCAEAGSIGEDCYTAAMDWFDLGE